MSSWIASPEGRGESSSRPTVLVQPAQQWRRRGVGERRWKLGKGRRRVHLTSRTALAVREGVALADVHLEGCGYLGRAA